MQLENSVIAGIMIPDALTPGQYNDGIRADDSCARRARARLPSKPSAKPSELIRVVCVMGSADGVSSNWMDSIHVAWRAARPSPVSVG